MYFRILLDGYGAVRHINQRVPEFFACFGINSGDSNWPHGRSGWFSVTPVLCGTLVMTLVDRFIGENRNNTITLNLSGYQHDILIQISAYLQAHSTFGMLLR